MEKGKIKVETVKKFKSFELTVEDEGKGMDEEELSKIFEPFYTKKRRSP